MASRLESFSKWLQIKLYQFEVTFPVYIFTPVEKFIFCTSSLFFLPPPSPPTTTFCNHLSIHPSIHSSIHQPCSPASQPAGH